MNVLTTRNSIPKWLWWGLIVSLVIYISIAICMTYAHDQGKLVVKECETLKVYSFYAFMLLVVFVASAIGVFSSLIKIYDLRKGGVFALPILFIALLFVVGNFIVLESLWV